MASKSKQSNKPPEAAAKGPSEDGGTTAAVLQAMVRPCLHAAEILIPLVIVNVARLYRLFLMLPQNALLFIYGFVTCFFGGTFPTLFAAIQAAKHGGRQTVVQAVSDLSDEVMIIIEASKKDDDADENHNGIRDVEEISHRELMVRKTKLVLRKMNPERVDAAISALYKVWLSVAAVLSIEFARTISLALTIVECLEKPVERFVAPIVRLATPAEYERWVPVVLSWIVKSIAMSFAWYIQSVISAFASALSGGLMMSRSLYQLLVVHKIRLFGLIPENHEDTYIDELLQHLFAGLGFYSQFKNNFSLPFPLNVILLPFQLAEYYIRWTITRRT
jgi:hypothetical protein